MSKTDNLHVVHGRKPWRHMLQLRYGQTVQEKTHFSASEHLLDAAYRYEPSSPLHNKELYLEAEWSLVELCKWLESRLHRPLKVIKQISGERRIEVFESFAYTISPEDRYFSASEIVEGDFPRNYNVEIGCPLSTSNWLEYVLVKLQLNYEYQGNLFVPCGFAGEHAEWLCKSAYSLLKKQAAFVKLRKELLPKAFQLPKHVYSIALASRHRPKGLMLDSKTFNIVWQNEEKFTQVARENPQLLPLVLLLAQNYIASILPDDKDPISLLKSVFLDEGLSEAAWRYVVHHGARLFNLPWRISDKQYGMRVAINYLKALDDAGLPPPPPPSVVNAWLNSYNGHDNANVYIESGFHQLADRTVLGIALKEASDRRLTNKLPAFAEEFLGVCWWSESLAKPLDVNQVQAGWPWMVKMWHKYESEQKLLAGVSSTSWKNTVEEFVQGTWRIVPIESSEQLICEALAMRNCLHDMIDKCEVGKIQIYSVRDCNSGKRKGCIGFVIYESKCAVIWDVKGFANTTPTNDLIEISKQLALQITSQLNRT